MGAHPKPETSNLRDEGYPYIYIYIHNILQSSLGPFILKAPANPQLSSSFKDDTMARTKEGLRV